MAATLKVTARFGFTALDTGWVVMVTGSWPTPVSEILKDGSSRSLLAMCKFAVRGPSVAGGAWTAAAQGRLLFELAGKPEKFIRVPVAVMDVVINLLSALSKVFPGLVDAAEFGRIGKYYATESMLVWDAAKGRYDAEATPEYGTDTLEAFFEKALKDGGLEGQELGDAAIF